MEIVIGGKQVYDLDLNYYFSNPSDQTIIQQIAIPPVLYPYQQLFVKSITPQPESITVDDDHNILASYQLKVGQEFNVRFQGQVQLQLDYDIEIEKLKDLEGLKLEFERRPIVLASGFQAKKDCPMPIADLS